MANSGNNSYKFQFSTCQEHMGPPGLEGLDIGSEADDLWDWKINLDLLLPSSSSSSSSGFFNPTMAAGTDLSSSKIGWYGEYAALQDDRTPNFCQAAVPSFNKGKLKPHMRGPLYSVAMSTLIRHFQSCSRCRDLLVPYSLKFQDLEALQNSHPSTTTQLCSTRSDPIFPAKEATQYSSSYSYYNQLATVPEISVSPDPGDSKIIWNSSASDSSYLYKFGDMTWFCLNNFDIPEPNSDELLNGWNEEWGNLRLPFFHARIGKLLGRDYVWVVTQTMVSYEQLALWAVYTALTYKVYPGFWGRSLRYKVYLGFW